MHEYLQTSIGGCCGELCDENSHHLSPTSIYEFEPYYSILVLVGCIDSSIHYSSRFTMRLMRTWMDLTV